MKSSRLFISIIIVVVFTFLFSGCAYRNQNQPVDSSAGQSQEEFERRGSSTAGDTLKVHFIDVGQGDAILVQTPSGQNMLIDAGENSRGDTVVDYLTSQGVTNLDVVVGTHPHSDHIGGLDTVIDCFPVSSIYMPQATQTTQSFRDVLTAIRNRGLQISTARAGVVIPLDGVSCRFMAPLQDSYEDLNDYSAVVKLEYGNQSFLFAGDAGTESEAQMLDSGADLKATVLKVAHHGSYSSSEGWFLSAVEPSYAVIMVGTGNSYGHPHAQTLDRLSASGAVIYRTDLNGTIVFSTDGSDMQIYTER